MNSLKNPQKKIIQVIILLSLGITLSVWFFFTPDGILGKADAVGYAVCHRISLRSLFIETRQMPMCARCTGMYLGTACALLFQTIISRRRGGLPPRRIALILVGLAVLWALDGGNSYIHLFPNMQGLYEPNNTLRLLTGSGIGIVAAVLLYPAFQQTVWIDWQPEPAIRGVKQMIAMMGMTYFVDWLVLLNHPYILLVAGLLSAAFVLVLLAMVYCMLLVILFKVENQWRALKEALLPLAAGLAIAVIQIGLLDWIRFFVTGSWQGIPFNR